MRKPIARRSIYVCLLTLAMAGCVGNNTGAISLQKQKPHLAEIKMEGAELYVDEVDNRMVLRETENRQGRSVFRSYLVGVRESVPTDTKQQAAGRRYFDYDMQHDWKMILNGDSLAPVFFQPKPTLNGGTKEGVMVFEIPGDKTPDALVYVGGAGSRGRQLILLHTQKK